MKTCETCKHYKPGRWKMLWCRLYKTFKDTAMPCVDHKEKSQ